MPLQNAAEAVLVLIDWLRVGDPDSSGLGVRVLDSGAGLAVAHLLGER